jgi:hypothetical protein
MIPEGQVREVAAGFGSAWVHRTMIATQEDTLPSRVLENARAGTFGIEAGVCAGGFLESNPEAAGESIDVSVMYFDNTLTAAVRADGAIDPRLDLRGE